ncbi:hypothetical protein T484DRAFT_3322668 [Baffinella frigidus]|nr:hypothetical protein T484DRAFT_3322668 [Cryptophyta sp. CCMP2293]
MSGALSLVCGDCGQQLKSADEAQAHAESTGHVNFSESTEAVLQLVCKECGKPCRSKTEQEMHTQRNPTHTEFVDKTSEQGQLSYAKGEADLLKAAEDSLDAEVEKVRATEQINKELLTQLNDMGFPENRAERALYFSGNENLEKAIAWLETHADDMDLDEVLMVPKDSGKPKMSKEEQKAMLEGRVQDMRKKAVKENRELERAQEINRIASMKELNDARTKQKEQEEIIAVERVKREKEKDALARAKVKAELEKDKMNRMAARGLKPEATQEKPKVVDPHKAKKIALGTKLRDVIAATRNDTASPNPGTKAIETANKYVENMVKNPTEEKFRSINAENAAFQRIIATRTGGMAMMEALGFETADGKLSMPAPLDTAWLEAASAELQLAAKRGPFY